jgi:hypothetical protein
MSIRFVAMMTCEECISVINRRPQSTTNTTLNDTMHNDATRFAP